MATSEAAAPQLRTFKGESVFQRVEKGPSANKVGPGPPPSEDISHLPSLCTLSSVLQVTSESFEYREGKQFSNSSNSDGNDTPGVV